MSSNKHYECKVTVTTEFIADQSDIEKDYYVFAYHISILNTGNVAVQLISRHWIIKEIDGKQQEVKGLGVVGHQPRLEPKERYEYSSGTVLNSPTGEMHGTYQMVAEDGTRFDATIAPFTLSMPRVLH